jgi:hypothetical protein
VTIELGGNLAQMRMDASQVFGPQFAIHLVEIEVPFDSR